jgi:peptidoglycan/xylan/chitin deacetylase (PgdA/CDA1 family)
MQGNKHIQKAFHRIQRPFRKLRRQFKPGAVILLYHRIIDISPDLYALTVSPEHFAQHLEYLRQTCHPMRLLDLAAAIQQHALPQRSVAITFDDGYRDNYSQALSLLKAAEVPATVFVVSGAIDSPHEFWWDELERLLLLPPHPPGCLKLRVQGKDHAWPTTSEGQRQLARKALHGLLRDLAATERASILAELADWAGLHRTGRPDYRAMTALELGELTQGGLLDLGAHTVSHPVLSSLSINDQYAEISDSRQRLESITGRPVLTFAYPYGAFTNQTVDMVKAVGFRAACTTVYGSVESGADRFRLQRFAVKDWDLETFKERLEAGLIA